MADGRIEITAMLQQLRDGDRSVRDRLLAAVYDDLEAIASAYAGSSDSLEPRALVHELYLRLVSAPLAASDRKHFFAIAALAMRQILIDRVRRRRAEKRGGQAVRVTLTGLADSVVVTDVIAIEEALAKLEALSARQARVVELRCLLGCTVPETAEALDVSERTVHADWRLARAWLLRELGPDAL